MLVRIVCAMALLLVAGCQSSRTDQAASVAPTETVTMAALPGVDTPTAEGPGETSATAAPTEASATVTAISDPVATAEPIAFAPFLQPMPQAEPRAYSAIVIDARRGTIIHEQNAEAPRFPASLTKMMTLYILFEEIDAGRFNTGSQLTVSKNAARQPPSKIGLKEGTTISVHDAISALSVRSANDVAVAVAENVEGTEEAFVRRMNRTARSLGMQKTRFGNASGLPDRSKVTTAKDMAVLGRALLSRHPRFARYFTQREFSYNGRTFKATNRLLGKVQGVNGIKTGYTRLSGYNLALSVRRGRTHVIAVIIGGRTGRSRDARMVDLIDTHFPRRSLFGFAFSGEAHGAESIDPELLEALDLIFEDAR